MSGAAEDIRQSLYALKRQRWRAGFMRWRRGGRLIMRVEATLEAGAEGFDHEKHEKHERAETDPVRDFRVFRGSPLGVEGAP